MRHPETKRTHHPAGRGLGLPALALGLVLGAGALWGLDPVAAAEPAAPEPIAATPPPPIRLPLPREWRQLLPPPITFDHMFRRDPDEVWR